MRNRFDEQLELLNKEMTRMGALCEEAIAASTLALSDGDTELAKKVSPIASEIDRMERDIEAVCLKLLLQQQPVAKDLRVISAALKMITDMERIGDQAEDIADIITVMGGRALGDDAEIISMARAAIGMVTDSVTAYVKRDVKLAEKVLGDDDVIDDYFIKMKQDLIKLIRETPEEGEAALDLLMISKYFERIGDHATNIAEWVIFSVTGVHEYADEK